MKLKFGPYSVETSHDDKLLFTKPDITKGQIVDYYRGVSDLILPHLENRCLTLQRYPDGIGAGGFYQQKRADHFPDFVTGKVLPTADGDESIEHIVVNNAAALAYLSGQATITFHGWLSRLNRPRHPDRIVFDLDPAGDDFAAVIDCARLLRDALDFSGLEAYVMTTGSRGLHVLSPLSGSLDFEAARRIAGDVAAAVAAQAPERYTTEQRKKARRGRLYIDISRNAYGQTAVLPYSLRAIEGAPVATPLAWDELGRGGLSPRRYHIGNLRRRIAQKSDPLEDFYRHSRRPQATGIRLEDWKPTA